MPPLSSDEAIVAPEAIVTPVGAATIGGYPKWQGTLSGAPRIWSIALNEVRRAYNDQWARSALILAAGYAVITIAQLAFVANTRPGAHSLDTFMSFLGLLRWAALGVAAVMAGVALLEDEKKGALELYLSRSVTRWTYLGGKVLAVLGMTFATLFLPALLYYAASWFVFETQPDGWAYVIFGALGYAAIWAVVVSGLGLGVSCLVRSSRAASILLFAGIAALDIVLGDILNAITRSEAVQLFSPMSDLDQQRVWLFNMEPAYDFPWWWATVALAGLALVGWILVWLRHPRLKGVS